MTQILSRCCFTLPPSLPQLEAGLLVPAYTKQFMTFRKRWFTPELQEQAKRMRRDFRESTRLKSMVAAQDAAAAGEGGKE